MADFIDKLAEFVCWTILTLYTKEKLGMSVNLGLRILCPTDAAFRSLSLRWGVSLTGSSSPVISILNVHWCDIQLCWWDLARWRLSNSFCLPRFRCLYTLASRIRLMQWSFSRRWTCPYTTSVLTHVSFDCNVLWIAVIVKSRYRFPFKYILGLTNFNCGSPAWSWMIARADWRNLGHPVLVTKKSTESGHVEWKLALRVALFD